MVVKINGWMTTKELMEINALVEYYNTTDGLNDIRNEPQGVLSISVDGIGHYDAIITIYEMIIEVL